MKGVSIPTVEKKLKTIKGFGPGIVSDNVKSHANEPFFIKKLEEATQTLQRVGLQAKKRNKVIANVYDKGWMFNLAFFVNHRNNQQLKRIHLAKFMMRLIVMYQIKYK